MQNFCQNCGQQLKPEDRICTNCDNPIPTSPPQVSPAYGHPSTSTPSSYQYPPQTPTRHPQATDANVSADTLNIFFGLSLLAGIVGGILLLTTDFGGSYNDDGYVKSWTYVGPWSSGPGGFLVFLAAAVALFFCAFISLKGIQSKGAVPRNLVKMGFLLALIIFIIVILGAIALFALTSENDSTWVDAGFYGGAISSLLILICLGMVLKNTQHITPQKRVGYRAPAPYYSPPSTQPPAQTPGPSMTQPLQQPSPAPQSTAQEPGVTGPTKAEEPIQAAPEGQPQVQQPYQQQQVQQPLLQQYQQPYYQQPQQPQYQAPASYPCPKCGQLMRFINEYKKWYCDNCRRYL